MRAYQPGHGAATDTGSLPRLSAGQNWDRAAGHGGVHKLPACPCWKIVTLGAVYSAHLSIGTISAGLSFYWRTG
jgi:hypothetical protein